MKKSDLTTGMRVEHRSGWVGIVLKDIGVIGYDNGYSFLTYWDEYLFNMDETDRSWDIVKVYEGFVANSAVLNLKEKGKLLWTRTEVSPEQVALSNNIEGLELKITQTQNYLTELSEELSICKERIKHYTRKEI